jgi:phospholipid/cholesterol/gamma-HCH transport system substrate-binding protein
MSTPTNNWKLGLFVVVGFCTALAMVVVLGARSLQKQTVSYTTYFDESVQGIEVGSPVKFRGVTIGKVSVIDVAADHRMVELLCELFVANLNSLGLSVEQHQGKHTKLSLPPDLRVQLGSLGLTGGKFILIDYFTIKDYPPPTLPFPAPANYIPSAPSMMKNLEHSVVHAADRFPEIAEVMLKVLTGVSTLVAEINNQKLFEKAVVTMTNVDHVLADADKAINQLEAGKLSQKASAAIAKLDVALTNVNRLVEQASGEKGLLASVQRTSDSLGGMAQNARYLGPNLEETLREVQAAAESIRRLADSIDRDPDMLLKGRAKKRTP